MKDKTLHSFRRTPDNTYTETLLQRLERIPETAVPLTIQPISPRRMRLAWAIVPLILMFFLLAAAPAVRARFEAVLRQIGGQLIFETEEYPGGDEEPIIVPDDIITLSEATAQLDFTFALPTYVPEGLVLHEDEVRMSGIIDGLRLQWTDDDTRGRALNLLISRAMPDVSYTVGPNSVTEVDINGVTAVLIHGGWYPDEQEWIDDGTRSLRWQLDDVVYQLSTGNEEFGGLSDIDLIQIAESIDHPSSGIR